MNLENLYIFLSTNNIKRAMKIYYLKGDINKNKNDKIYYFDNNSTTLIYDKNIKHNIMKWISCGNPSNTLHNLGKNSHNKIMQCRHIISRDLNVYPCELYFTSGATESNNIIVQGIIRYYLHRIRSGKENMQKFSIVTSSFEHPLVAMTLTSGSIFNNISIAFLPPIFPGTSKSIITAS